MAETDNNLQSVASSYDDVNNALKQLTGQVESTGTFATKSDLNNYMPLTGGTVNGAVTVVNGVATDLITSTNNGTINIDVVDRRLAIQNDGNLVFYHRGSDGQFEAQDSVFSVGRVNTKGEYEGNFVNLYLNSGGAMNNSVTFGAIPSLTGVDQTRQVITQCFSVSVNTSQSPCQVYFPKAFASVEFINIQVTPICSSGAGSGSANAGFYVSGASSTSKPVTTTSMWIDTGFVNQYSQFFITATGYLS